MDLLSLIGVIIGFAAIIGGNYLEGGHMSALVNLPAGIIVIGGTVGAALLQTPMLNVKRALAMLPWVWSPPKLSFKQGVKKLVGWAQTARKEGLLGLEVLAESETDRFARKGLQLLVDGNEPESIRNVLEMESYLIEQRDIDSARFFESMGGYAPTIGIVGAVMGLIHVMGNLADPSKLGPGIAVAFVATIYGVASANLIFLPIANKLKACVKREANYREMVVEGIISIADGENPRAIDLKLNGYVRNH
jgi:chemotaxis protein MotA